MKQLFTRVLVLAPLALASCAASLESRVESVLREALPRVIGPADRYEVTVKGADSNASHFDEVHAVGRRVQRPKTPVIDRFQVDLQDVAVDRPNKQVTSIGAARALVQVKADDLASYLARQSWISQPTVRLRPPDGLEVSGFLKVPGVQVPGARAALAGRLVPDGSRLLIAVDSLSLGDRQAPVLLRGLVSIAVNPLFDLSTYALPSTIDRVDVQGDAIVVEASGSRMRVAPRQ